jgi:hypothetical protein
MLVLRFVVHLEGEQMRFEIVSYSLDVQLQVRYYGSSQTHCVRYWLLVQMTMSQDRVFYVPQFAVYAPQWLVDLAVDHAESHPRIDGHDTQNCDLSKFVLS